MIKKQLKDDDIKELINNDEKFTAQIIKGKEVFKNLNYDKKIKTFFKTMPLVILLTIIAGFVLPYFNVEELGVIYIFFVIVLILGIIFYPLSIIKFIVFDIDEHLYISRMLKKNFLGLNSVLLNFEHPEKIGRIVIKQTDSYYYITFREAKGDLIREGSPVLFVEKADTKSYEYVYSILLKMREYSGHEVEIINL